MNFYDDKAVRELKTWKHKMQKKPSYANIAAKNIQNKVNNFIPEKVHFVITEAIKNMVKVVLLGSGFITDTPLVTNSLEQRETLVKKRMLFYKRAAAASGAWTGAGGILLGFADFPILLSFKLKFLFDTAALYGFNTNDYKERLYILYIFQLAFSSQERTREIFFKVSDWENQIKALPKDINLFDWRTFQQEYRDYIDIAKMLQLVPVIGAVVGAYANYKLLNKLGETAMNAYRLRLLLI